MELGKDYGITFENKKLAWKEMKARRDGFIKKIQCMHFGNIQKNNVQWIKGKAKFLSTHEIEVVEVPDKTIKCTAPHIVIATGSKPMIPEKLPGIEFTMSTDDFFGLEELPNNILIMGGDYIGVEICSMLATFGIKTTICTQESSIIPSYEKDIMALQMEIMKNMGVQILTETQVTSIEELGKRHYRVNFEKHSPVEVESVICATGRLPNYEGLDIDKMKFKMTSSNVIETDAYENTSVPGVYAIGDANAKMMLTPVGISAAKKLAIRIFKNIPESKLNYNAISSVVFSLPPMCKCGLTEEEAKLKYGTDKIKIYRSQFNQLCYAFTEHKVPTLMKIVCLLPEEKILGLHGVGKGIDEIIQGFCVAMHVGITKKDLDETVAIHPTAAEEFVTMK